MQTFVSLSKRTLSFREYGDLKGLPVFFNHGNLNSRLFAPAWDKTESLTKDAGVRVIAVDRHGVGGSSFDETIGYSLFAEDVKDLADHLQLQTFAVAGFSSGGPYSMAIAAKFPSRVRALALISSDAPYLLLGEDFIKRQYGFVGFGQKEAEKMVEFAYKELKGAYAGMKKEDRRELALADLNEAVKEGFAGPGKDAVLETSKWDFELSTIQCPVTFWHGDADKDVPLEACEFSFGLVQAQQKEKKILEKETHSLIRRHWQQILEALVSQCADGKL